MPLFAFEEHEPSIHPTAFIAPTAVLIGEVIVEENASIWFNVVIRADYGPITIRAGANVQDGAVLHGGADFTEIGPGATLGHMSLVHGAKVGAETLIGNGAIVLDGARVGSRSLIAAGSTVPPNAVIPDGVMAMGTPAKVRGPLTESARHWVDDNGETYRKLAKRYSAGLRSLD
ncbi:gamma carbonic anhydrase family protein [Jatrophihabitans sp. DSM 45814]